MLLNVWDGQVEVERVSYGGDVLMWCSKERPDLLVLDEELSDMPCGEIIRSIRRSEELNGLKILCWAKARNTQQYLEWGADGALAKEASDPKDLASKLYDLLEIPEERLAAPETFEHQRRWPRVSVRLPAKIILYRLRAPQQNDTGTAIVENIGHKGAYLSHIQPKRGVIPCEPFRILLEVDQKPLRNWQAYCKVVRLKYNGSLGAGVEFAKLSKSNLRMLQPLFQQRRLPVQGSGPQAQRTISR